MKKNSFKSKIQYKFDNLMAKGSIALVGVLFLATAIVAIIVGIVMVMLGKTQAGLGENVWISIMHIIDPGTITGADLGNMDFIVLMSIATICGIFVTSILIGIITAGFEAKLEDLKKGNSRVVETNHTVVLGFNSSIYTILSELIKANESEKKPRIVILAEEDKETIEECIANNINDFKNTKIICRTGSIYDLNMIEKCSLETCKSIIVNEKEDSTVVKSVLAVNNYLKENCHNRELPHVVCTINEKANYDAIQLISLGNVEMLIADESIAKIIAQTCRQPGLTNVLFELFDFDGDELYFEKHKEVEGKFFGEILNYFDKGIVFGFRRGKEVSLNPSKDTILQENDELLILMEDNGAVTPKEKPKALVGELVSEFNINNKAETVLIVGTNHLLEKIIIELGDFLEKGSKVIIADKTIDDKYKKLAEELESIEVEFYELDTEKRSNLEELLKHEIEYALLLSDEKCDEEESDAKNLVNLINLRDISLKENKKFSITSELKIVKNQKLAQITRVKDLIIGSDVINLLLTQIAENRDLAKVFKELLEADGAEVHIKPVEKYIKLGVEVDFYQVTEMLKEKDVIAIGYKKCHDDTFEIITNPNKSEKIIFEQGDAVIVLANE